MNKLREPHDIDWNDVIESQKKHITLELMEDTFLSHQANDTEEEFNEFVDAYWSGLEGTGI